MKLLKKYRFYTYTSLVFVVMIGFTINYYLFRFSIHRTTDDVLNEYRIDIEEYASMNGSLSGFNSMNNKLCRISENLNKDADIDEGIVDTLVYSHYEKEMVVYRKLNFQLNTNGRNYTVMLMLPTLEEDDLIETVIISLMLFVLLFSLFTTLIDRFFTFKIQRPFTRILEVMRTYNIEAQTDIQLRDGDIDEFRDLNLILTGMMTKINHGYDEMKEFLEHTSHEMKTPLAIIQLKLESLNQKNFKDEEILQSISIIQTELRRIILFNRSLLFITKIKNNQFHELQKMNLNTQITKFLNLYNELLSERKIDVNFNEEGVFITNMHPILAEQLIQNILSNALRYNYNHGYIKIDTSESYICVKNSFDSEPPKGDLFEKYKRSTKNLDSSGLGLAIVKNICEKNNLKVTYEIKEKNFIISIHKA